MVSYTRIRHYSSNLGVLNMKSENRLGRETRRSSAPSSRRPGRSTMPPSRGSSRRSRRGRVRVAPRKRSRNKATILLLSTLVVMLVLVVGGIAVKVINSESTPEATVRDYVQLIADGKYDEANKVVDPGVTGTQSELLTSKAYSKIKGAVKFDSISGLQYDKDDDSATVNVDLLVSGHPMEAELKVESYTNNFGLRKWKILTPLLVQVQIYRHAYLSSYKIGSAIVNMKSQDHYGSVSYMMYPGVYNIEGQSVNPEYVEINSVGKQFVAVAMQHGSTGSESDFYASFEFNKHFTVKPTEKLKTWALPQIQSRIKSCASISYPRKDNSCPVGTWSPFIHFKALEVKTLPTALYSVAYVNGTSLIAARADGVIRVTTAKSSGTSGQEISETKDLYYAAAGVVDFDKQRQPILKWDLQ